MHETLCAPAETTVRAGVNETKLFSSLKHLFSSSTSFLGELMQNARRAGASKVDFAITADRRTVVITDDGRGIRDFQPLVTFAESGWDEQTMLSDRPFGMGLFSILFACEQVTFESCGHRLQVDIDAVVKRRPLLVERCATAPSLGTRITLSGVEASLVMPYAWYGNKQVCAMAAALTRLAAGFPIPVVVNGEDQPRPHAKDALAGEETPVGFVSDPLVQGPQDNAYSIYRHSSMVFYLQGLPIDRRNNCAPSVSDVVIHLDDSEFRPTMPDRAHLYDSDQARKRIQTEVKAARIRFLRARKAAMSGRDFVASYWETVIALGADTLVADIPWVPASLFKRADLVTREHNEPYAPFVGVQRQPGGEVDHLVSREDLCTGVLKVWINGPFTVDETDEVSAVGLLVMNLEDIYMADRVPASHWLHDVCPNYGDLEFVVSTTMPSAEASYTGHSEYHAVNIQVVPHVDIRITSQIDPAYRLERRVTTGWVLCQSIETDDVIERDVATVYVCDDDTSIGHPVDALACFEIDDTFDEDLQRDCRQEWDSIVAALNGASVGDVLRSGLSDLTQVPMKQHLGKFALVHVTTEKGAGDRTLYRWACADLDDEMVDKLASAFETADASLPTAARLKQALAILMT